MSVTALPFGDADGPRDEELKVSELHQPEYAPPYQRITKLPQARRIAAEYDERAFDVIKVSYRDGRYYVYDGLHRLAAYMIMGRDSIRAKVSFDMTVKEEARLWGIANDTMFKKNGTQAERFTAALVEGKPDAVEVRRLLNLHGLVYPRDTATYAEWRKIIARHGSPALDLALEACAVLPHEFSIQIPQWLLAGTAYLFAASDRFTVSRMQKAIRRDFSAMKMEIGGSGKSWGSGTVRWARIVQTSYNFGLTKNKVEVV